MFRFVIYGITTACLTFVYSLRLVFNSTILCQYDPSANATDYYLYNPTFKVLSYSAPSIGLALALPPLFYFNNLGTKNTFLTYGAIGFIPSFLYPLADAWGFYPAFFIRLFQGVPGAMTLWTMNIVSHQWAPEKEKGLAVAILSCYYQLSPVVASIASGEFCTTLGWQWTYYFLSGISAILYAVFLFLYKNNPLESRYISQKESVLFLEKESEKPKISSKIPYSAIFADPQAYLAWFLYFSFFVGLNIFLQFGPVYISLVLNFDIKSTGYAAALPHLLCLVSKFAYGRVLDKCLGFSQRTRLILAYSLVETISVACLGIMIYANSVAIVLTVYVLFNSLHNLVIIVVMRQKQLIARQYAHFLTNGNTFIAAVCIFATSFLQYIFIDNTREQWAVVFLGIGGMMIASVVLFAFFSKSEPRKWTEIEPISNEIVN